MRENIGGDIEDPGCSASWVIGNHYKFTKKNFGTRLIFPDKLLEIVNKNFLLFPHDRDRLIGTNSIGQ